MNAAVRKRIEDAIDNAYAEANKFDDKASGAKVWLTTNSDPSWQIMIGSAWSSYGEDDWTGTYSVPTLREAIRCAATDFCRENGRTIPGKPGSDISPGFSKNPDAWDTWDVQGTFYVSLLAGPLRISIENGAFEKHVKELKKSTTDNYWDPPTKKKVQTIP